ncbi:hypothetical protein R3P38DRAFT_2894856 [Favolaschia claudopus]|uniref:Uncharacterized protein n=1 Tax=Favolaschia claudopus TaxID=2862362 RepID=A0AAW0CNS9_9AGAR
MSAIRSPRRPRRRSSFCNPCLIIFVATFLLVFYRAKIKELFPQSTSLLSALEWAGDQLLLGFSAGLFLSGVGLFVSLLRDGKNFLFPAAAAEEDAAELDATMSDGALQSLEAGLHSASSDVPSPSSEYPQPIAGSPTTSQSQPLPAPDVDLPSPAVTFRPFAKLLCMILCSASVWVDLWLRGILSSRNPPATALEVMLKVLKHLLAGVEVLSVVSMVLLAFMAWKSWRPGRSRWAGSRDASGDEELELVGGGVEGEDKGIEELDDEEGESLSNAILEPAHEDRGREMQKVDGGEEHSIQSSVI